MNRFSHIIQAMIAIAAFLLAPVLLPAQGTIRITPSLQKDLSVGYYYIRLVFHGDFTPTGAPGSATYDTAYAQYQRAIDAFYSSNEALLKDPNNYTITEIDPTTGNASSSFKPKNVERLKTVIFSPTLLGSLSAKKGYPKEVVLFLWAILGKGSKYTVSYSPATNLVYESDTTIQLDDASYFSPLETEKPLTFDFQPISETMANFDIEYRAGLLNPAKDPMFLQFRASAEGQRLSPDLADSLMSVSGLVALRTHLGGFWAFRSFSASLQGEVYAGSKFESVDYGGSFQLGALIGLLSQAEGISLTVSADFFRMIRPDTNLSQPRLTLGLEWQPTVGPYGLDISAQGWNQDFKFDADHRLYYYRALATYDVLNYGTAYIGYSQGFLPPSFVFNKQFDIGVRLNVDNITNGK